MPTTTIQRRKPSLIPAGVWKNETVSTPWVNWLCVLLFVCGYFGFHLLLFSGLAFNLPNRFLTIPVRAVALGCSIVVFAIWIANKWPMYRGKLWIPLIGFWGFYAIRIYSDRYDPTLMTGWRDYFIFGFGTCFLPMLGFMATFSRHSMRRAFWGLIICGGLACGLSSFIYRSLFQGEFGRIQAGQMVAEFTGISPLTLSYLASAYIVFGVYLFFERKNIRHPIIRYALPLVVIAVGTVPLLLGASRGSVIAIVIPCGLLLLARFKSSRDIAPVVVSSIVVLGFCVWLYLNATNLGSNLITRLLLLGSDIEIQHSSTARLYLYNQAWQQFLSSPLAGSGLVISPSGSYPHNLFLESFMSTGIIGGLFFTTFTVCCLWRAYQILGTNSGFGWVGMLFLHYFILGQFSSSITTNSFFWISAAAVLAAHRSHSIGPSLDSRTPPL